MRASARLMALLAAAALAGCELVSTEPAISRITTAVATPSWRNDIAPILNQTCASSGACHGGTSPQRDLNLTADSSYANVVGQLTSCCGQLVIPGDSANSFLPRVMSTDITVRGGYPWRMPLTGTPMPQPIVQTIKNWIAQGAANN